VTGPFFFLSVHDRQYERDWFDFSRSFIGLHAVPFGAAGQTMIKSLHPTRRLARGIVVHLPVVLYLRMPASQPATMQRDGYAIY
jgi:hypothetical protein